AEPGSPGVEVVPDRFVGMQAVDMEQVDAAVRDLARRVVERHALQRRERCVERVVVGPQVLVDRSEERRVGKEWRSRGAEEQAEDGIRDRTVTGVQTCALPISLSLGRQVSKSCLTAS